MGLFPSMVIGSSMGLFPKGNTSRSQLVTGVWTAGKNFFMRCFQFKKYFKIEAVCRKSTPYTPCSRDAHSIDDKIVSASNEDVAFYLHHGVSWSVTAGPLSCRNYASSSIKHAHKRKCSEDKLPAFRIMVIH